MRPKDDQKLEAIAQATYGLVEETGLSGLTMPAIAQRAGIATGTLYVYYASKDELLTALYERAKTAGTSRLMKGDEPSAPFRSRFQRMWTNWLDHRLTHSAEMVFVEQYYNSPWFSDASRDASVRLSRNWIDLIELAKKQQIMKDVPTVLLLNSFGGSVRETANLLKSGALKRTKANLEMAFALCWDGLKA